MNYADWNHSLLLADVLIVIGGMKLVASTSNYERLISIGVLVQAIVLMLASNGAIVVQAELHLAAVVMVGVYFLWTLIQLTANQTDAASEVIHDDRPPSSIEGGL